MTDDEKQMLKVGADTALKPFANLLERLFGGPVDEIGGSWQDTIRIRRLARRIKLYQRLKEMIADAGFDPRQIPENIWCPALQHASIEDDESLQERWAALLANASDPSQSVLKHFPDILSQLTPDDVLVLEWLATFYGVSGYITVGSYRDVVHAARKALNRKNLEISMDNLFRLRLIRIEPKMTIATPDGAMGHRIGGLETGEGSYSESQVTLANTENLYFTQLGREFVNACRTPQRSN